MSETENKNPIVNWFSNANNIILSVVGVVTGFNACQNDDIQGKLKNQLTEKNVSQVVAQTVKTEIETEIEQKRFSNDQLFLLYREIKESIKQQDCDQQILLTMVVDNVLADNIKMRDSLRNFIVRKDPTCTAAKYIVKEKVNEELFEKTDKAVLSKFTIDVFYLDDILEEAKPRAEKIAELLRQKFPDFTVRPRLLSQSINARKGYRIDENQIRFEEKETDVANQVYNLIVSNKVFTKEQPKKYQIEYPTPGYISVFVRNI